MQWLKEFQHKPTASAGNIKDSWKCKHQKHTLLGHRGLNVVQSDGIFTQVVWHISIWIHRQKISTTNNTTRTALLLFISKFILVNWTTLRVDYFNSVLSSACAAHLHPLQSVLNAAARLVTRRRKFDSILDSMHYDLRWLPVRQRIHFKTCVLVNKCRNHTALSYLTEMCVPVSTISSRRHLRSAAHYDMTVPRTRLMRLMDRAVLPSSVQCCGTRCLLLFATQH